MEDFGECHIWSRPERDSSATCGLYATTAVTQRRDAATTGARGDCSVVKVTATSSSLILRNSILLPATKAVCSKSCITTATAASLVNQVELHSVSQRVQQVTGVLLAAH